MNIENEYQQINTEIDYFPEEEDENNNNLQKSEQASSSLNCMKKDEAGNVIVDKYVLQEIIKEYQQFADQKDKLIGVIKENNKKMLDIIDLIKFPSLEKYLCDNSNDNLKSNLKYVNQFKCELCNYFVCNTKKSLSAHQRGCKKYVGSF